MAKRSPVNQHVAGPAPHNAVAALNAARPPAVIRPSAAAVIRSNTARTAAARTAAGTTVVSRAKRARVLATVICHLPNAGEIGTHSEQGQTLFLQYGLFYI